MDGSHEASHEKTEAPSHSAATSQDATNNLFTLNNGIHVRIRSEVTRPIKEWMKEVAEDVRERWEISDNPVVQKIQEASKNRKRRSSWRAQMKLRRGWQPKKLRRKRPAKSTLDAKITTDWQHHA